MELVNAFYFGNVACSGIGGKCFLRRIFIHFNVKNLRNLGTVHCIAIATVKHIKY